ncbi:MAG: tRNA (pseudouridine(54)-N(1))-methyltransferase [Methanosaeta sp. PtaU1.Bin060]|nr:MAG: tRNA (pseudouridine(54)-N(1))-methyltransferase [Methanosaeta sp. PtaU1.Bin060]
MQSTSGIFVRTGGLAEVIADLKTAVMLYLREDGADIRGVKCSGLCDDSAYILGDHTGMTPDEETLIEQAGASVVSLGPVSLHADHCIAVVNWLCDACVIEDH